MKLSKFDIFFTIFVIITLLFIHLRGVGNPDEGQILDTSLKLLNGQIIYNDFFFPDTPGSIFLTSIAFYLLSPSILSSRILMFFISLISVYLIFKIVLNSTKNKYYSYLSLLLFIAWGPAQINSASPVMFAIFSGLLTCYFLLNFRGNKKVYQLFFAGILSFTVFVCSKFIGISILIPVLVYLFFTQTKEKIKFLNFLFGYVWSLIFFIIYLLLTDSFESFVVSFFTSLSYTYNTYSPILNRYLNDDFNLSKIIASVIPLISSILAILLLLIRKRYYLLFIPFFVLSFYISVLYLYNDFFLIPLVALSGLSIVLLIRFTVNSNLRIALYFLIYSLIYLGFLSLFNEQNIFNKKPSLQNNIYSANKRIRIFLDKDANSYYRQMSEYIKLNSRENDYIYSSFDPMLYFITDRKNPINLENSEEKILGNIVAKNVELIIIDSDNYGLNSVKDYVDKNYHEIGKFKNYKIMKKK